MVLRTWNEHEAINDTSLSFELFYRIGRSRSFWTREKNGISYSGRLGKTDSELVHGLLRSRKRSVLGSSPTEKDCSPFDNDRLILLHQPESRNPLNMMRNGFCSILDHRFFYESYEVEDEKVL